MPKSINTSKSTTTPKFIPAASQTTFDIGNAVLCPSLSSQPFVLTADPYGSRNVLALEFEGNYFYYDTKGFFVSANERETEDFQPSLYHNTPSNQLAIDTLYGHTPTIPSSQRKVIDATEANDDEVILISPFYLSDIACDMEGAATVLDDIGQLLGLIYTGKLTESTSASMARIAHDSTSAWTELLLSRATKIEDTLAKTSYGKVEG